MTGRARRTRRADADRWLWRSRPFLLLNVLAWAFTTAAAAHDFWIDAESLRPAPGSTITVYIRGGHYFPSSELALADRLIGEFAVRRGDADRALDSRIDGKQRIASIDITTHQTHRIALRIRRPQQHDPIAWATLLLIPAGGESDPATYARGSGLEIVPRARIEDARKGHAFPFSILRDGAPIRATFQIQAADGGTTWLESDEHEPALFMPRKSGRHLAIVTDRTQTATLVFEVSP